MAVLDLGLTTESETAQVEGAENAPFKNLLSPEDMELRYDDQIEVEESDGSVVKDLGSVAGKFAAGAAAFIPSVIGKYATVGGAKLNKIIAQEIQDSDYYTKLSPAQQVAVSKLAITSPEEQQKLGEKVQNWIGSLGGALNVIPEPETLPGKVLRDVVGGATELIAESAHALPKKLIPDSYPNLQDFMGTVAELGVFGELGKSLHGKKGKAVEEVQNQARELVDAGKIEEANALIEESLAKPEINEVIEGYKKAKEAEAESPGTAEEYINNLFEITTPEGKQRTRAELLKRKPTGRTMEAGEFIEAAASGEKPQGPVNKTQAPGIQPTPMDMGKLGGPKTDVPKDLTTAQKRQWEIERQMKEADIEAQDYGVEDISPTQIVREVFEKPAVEARRNAETPDVKMAKKKILMPVDEGAISKASETRVREKPVEETKPVRSRGEQLTEEFIPAESPKALSRKQLVDKIKQRHIDKLAKKNPELARKQSEVFEGVEEGKAPDPKKQKELEQLIDESEMAYDYSKEDIYEEYVEDAYEEYHEGYEGSGDTGFFDTFFDVLNNERGEVQLGEFLNSFKKRGKKEKVVDSVEKLSGKDKDRILAIDAKARAEGKNLGEYLLEIGLSPDVIPVYVKRLKDIKGTKKVFKEGPQPEPRQSDLVDVNDIDSNAILRDVPVDEMVNRGIPGRIKKKIKSGEITIEDYLANKPVKIDRAWGEAIADMVDGNAPWIVEKFTTATNKFRDFPAKFMELKNHAADIELKMSNEKAALESEVKTLNKSFKDRKGREAEWIKSMERTKDGPEALAELGVDTNVTRRPGYQKLTELLEQRYAELLDKVNDVRERTGLERIEGITDFIPFFTKESMWSDLHKTFVESTAGDYIPKNELGSLLGDSLDVIKHRHRDSVMKEVMFAHKKRGKLRKGTKLVTDPLEIYMRYGNDAIKFINTEPLVAMTRELVHSRITDPVTGKNYQLATMAPKQSKFLSDWANRIGGKPNFGGSPKIERGLTKLMNNMTASRLLLNLSTFIAQSTAGLQTFGEFGLGNSVKGALSYMNPKETTPIAKSRKLPARQMHVFYEETLNMLEGNKVKRGINAIENMSKQLLSMPDYIMAEHAWRTAYESVKGKMNEAEAVRFADEAVVRTQGSGALSDLSQVQMNSFGKFLTLWQTFTINHINWIAKDVLGIKNPEVSPMETTKRVMRYMAGAYLLNEAFGAAGVNSPVPSPIYAAVKGMRDGDAEAAVLWNMITEVASEFPVVSSMGYGSTPLGAGADFFGDVSEALKSGDGDRQGMLVKAMMGNSKAALGMGDLVGTALGLPGTGQATKYMRGEMKMPNAPFWAKMLNSDLYDKNKSRGGRKKRKARKSDR